MFKPVDFSTMSSMVRLELDALIAAKQDFSSYQVTLNLRGSNPSLNIEHSVVQGIVHEEMYSRILSGQASYGVENRVYPDGNTAATYYPVTTPAQIGPTVPDIDWDSLFLN